MMEIRMVRPRGARAIFCVLGKLTPKNQLYNGGILGRFMEVWTK
jgi:hypothetical protein